MRNCRAAREPTFLRAVALWLGEGEIAVLVVSAAMQL
jgi:hypothetical protein